MKEKFFIKALTERHFAIVPTMPLCPTTPAGAMPGSFLLLGEFQSFLTTHRYIPGTEQALQSVQKAVQTQGRFSVLVAENGTDRPLIALGTMYRDGENEQFFQLMGEKIILTKKRKKGWAAWVHLLVESIE